LCANPLSSLDRHALPISDPKEGAIRRLEDGVNDSIP